MENSEPTKKLDIQIIEDSEEEEDGVEYEESDPDGDVSDDSPEDPSIVEYVESETDEDLSEDSDGDPSSDVEYVESDSDEKDSDCSDDNSIFDVDKKTAPSSNASIRGESQFKENRIQERSRNKSYEKCILPDGHKDKNKAYKDVRNMIQGGQLEKLKLEQCKIYLRKHHLRLTGNKETLIKRILDHTAVADRRGEEEYPPCSFTINCKGDACMGDVVMFKQRIRERFNTSRGAGGQRRGIRIVAGRIVKESYGAAKQQHTFTIEVIWSKGMKRLPSLHPLLIKGRNLYRMRTMRQEWDDESKREKILLEKHSRGSIARSKREARIHCREIGKMLKGDRTQRRAGTEKSLPVPSNRHKRQRTLQEGGIALPNARFHTALSGSVTQVMASNPYPAMSQSSSFYMYRHHSPVMIPERLPYHHQLCKYYTERRCCFGDKCKYLHETGREYKQRRYT